MAYPAISRTSQTPDGNFLSALRNAPSPATGNTNDFSTVLDQRLRNHEAPPAPERPASRPASQQEGNRTSSTAERRDDTRPHETTRPSDDTRPKSPTRAQDDAPEPSPSTPTAAETSPVAPDDTDAKAATAATEKVQPAGEAAVAAVDTQEIKDAAPLAAAADATDTSAEPATLAAIASILAALDRSPKQPASAGDTELDVGSGEDADLLLPSQRRQLPGTAPARSPEAASPLAVSDKPAKSGSANQASFAAAQAQVLQSTGTPSSPGHQATANDMTLGNGLSIGGLGPAQRADANTPAQLHVHTPAGQRVWAEDVGSRMLWMVGRGESKAELMLTPPSLGKLSVSIQVNGDQTTAQFVAATSAARDALEQAMPRLREVLQQAGINLGQTNVSTSSEHQARDDTGGRGSSRGRGEAHDDAPGIDGLATAQTANWTRVSNGAIDTFA